MGRNRFVDPDVVRLQLSDGDWIDVKKRLNAGETRKVFARQIKSMNMGDRPQLDPEQVGRSKVVEYMLGWSFVGKDEKPVQFSEAALDNLDADTYGEIVAAIDTHAEQVEKEIEERKNARAGATSSSATLQSVA